MKTIIGTGLLTLPSGVARLAESGGALESEALVLAAVFMAGFGALSAWGFFLIGAVCSATGATSVRPSVRPCHSLTHSVLSPLWLLLVVVVVVAEVGVGVEVAAPAHA